MESRQLNKSQCAIRGRQGAQAMLKIKNNMLTAVLVVTTLPPSVPVSLELAEQICYTVGRAAAEINEVRQRCHHKMGSDR
jgi:hypothetical protein